MIYDWYNGGEWGGLPVRRLGHIMADIINACHALKLVSELFSVKTTYAPQFEKNPETLFTGWGTAGFEAIPSDFDDLPVGSETIATNYREALAFLEGLADVEPGTSAIYWASEDTGDAVITLADMGLTAPPDPPARPQEVTQWGVLRDAIESVRYLRLIQSGGVGGIEAKAQTSWDATFIDVPGEVEKPIAIPNMLTELQAVIDSTTVKADSGTIGPVYMAATATAVPTFPLGTYLATCISKVKTTSAVYNLRAGNDDAVPDFVITDGYITFSEIGSTDADGIDVYLDSAEGRIEDGTRVAVSLETATLTVTVRDTGLHTLQNVTLLESGTYQGEIGFSAYASLLEVTYDTHDTGAS